MNPKRNRRQGKKVESKIAELLGGRRMGTMGMEDVDCGQFSIECKNRKKFVGTGFMAQAIANRYKDKIPMVVVHVTGQRHIEDLVMIRMSDWIDLYGKPGG